MIRGDNEDERQERRMMRMMQGELIATDLRCHLVPVFHYCPWIIKTLLVT